MQWDTMDLEMMLREDSNFNESAILDNKCPDIHILINKYIAEKGLSHADVICKLNVERSYSYQLLNGRRTPTRMQIIKLGFIFKLDLDEIQRLLKTAGKSILYARNVDDARIIYAIEHKYDYDKACEFALSE